MKLLLRLSALASGILSVPSLAIWIIFSMFSLFSFSSAAVQENLANGAIYLFVVAGWFGWASLSWLALHFKDLGLVRLPTWVALGLTSGAAVAIFSLSARSPAVPIQMPQDIGLRIALKILFGGAPLAFSCLAMYKYFTVRIKLARAHA